MQRILTCFALTTVLFVSMLSAPACSRPVTVTLTGQTALAITQSVDEVRKLTNSLVDQKVLTPQQGITVLERLKQVNARIEPLPALLRLVDVNNPDASTVEKALAILEAASQDMSVVIAGVPIGESAQKLVDLVRATQKTITTTLIEIAKVRN